MRNAIFTAALVCGSIGAAHAVTLESTGSIQNRCSFGTVSPGILSVNESDFSQFGTEFAGGQGAQVAVNYFGTPTLTVSTPSGFSTSPDLTDAGAVTFNHLAVLATAPFEELNVSADSSVEHQFTAGSTDTLQVGVTADAEDSLPVGSYAIATEATCI